MNPDNSYTTARYDYRSVIVKVDAFFATPRRLGTGANRTPAAPRSAVVITFSYTKAAKTYVAEENLEADAAPG